MKLPETFTFSQHNLQDYVECRYRFLLKYILGIDWPAIESEPLLLQETRMELGVQFHRLAQQYFAGVDQLLLESTIMSDDLAEWWQSFIALKLYDLPGEKFAEKTLSIPIADYRLIAKYDLLIRNTDGSYLIYDWKTSTRLPSQAILMDRMQTIIYPFLLASVLSANDTTSNSIPNVEMIYWFPSHPADPVKFTYSCEQLANDRAYLLDIVKEITENDENWFVKTVETKKCSFCRYRSLCERGINAGELTGEEDFLDPETAFDFDFNSL